MVRSKIAHPGKKMVLAERRREAFAKGIISESHIRAGWANAIVKRATNLGSARPKEQRLKSLAAYLPNFEWFISDK